MIVTPRGHIRVMSPHVALWLKQSSAKQKRQLLRALVRWAARGAETPFCWEAKGKLYLARVADYSRKRSRYLILEECAPPPRSLTAREAAVLHWIGYAKKNEEIAALLHVKICTIKKHLQHMYDKLGVDNRTAAASFTHAMRVGEGRNSLRIQPKFSDIPGNEMPAEPIIDAYVFANSRRNRDVGADVPDLIDFEEGRRS